MHPEFMCSGLLRRLGAIHPQTWEVQLSATLWMTEKPIRQQVFLEQGFTACTSVCGPAFFLTLHYQQPN